MLMLSVVVMPVWSVCSVMLKTWFADQRFKSAELLCWRLLMRVCLAALFHNDKGICKAGVFERFRDVE